MKRIAALLVVLFLGAIAAVAQQEGSNDNGFLLNMLQNQLSAPGRQIKLSGVSGLLSSKAKVEEITISDAQGPWLRVTNAELDWSRAALLLGRVNINRLGADQITFIRQPVFPPQPLQAEATPFKLPELPVAIRLQELAIQKVTLDQAAFGVAADMSVNGRVNLIGGALDTSLAIKRLDEPGGSVDLTAAFSNETRQLGLDLHLAEPRGGLLSKLLRIENEPALELRIAGNGPLDNVDVTFDLQADKGQIAGGKLALRAKDDGLGFDVALEGGLSPLIPAQYRDFFAGESVLRAAGVRKTDGGVRIDSMALKGAVLDLSGNLDTAPDGFPRNLNLTGTLGDAGGPSVVLPVPGGGTSLTSAQLRVSYGGGTRWTGVVALDRLVTGDIQMEDVTLNMGGRAENLDDPTKRFVTITLEGLATGVWAQDPRTAKALGNRIDLFADAVLPPVGPGKVNQVQISGNGLSIFTAGTLEDWVYTGRNTVTINDISPWGGLAGRDLAGSVNVRANGSVSPLSGGFNLALDGTATNLRLDDPRIDGLLAGETRLSGQVVRDEAGIRTNSLRLANPQVEFNSDGTISSTKTDFGFDTRISDLALVDPRLKGALSANGTAKGDSSAIDLAFDATIPEGRLLDRELKEARVGFTGTVKGRDLTGSLSGGGSIGDLPITVIGDLLSQGDKKAINGLTLAVGPNVATGDISQKGTDPILGHLSLRAPDIAPLAAFALVEASGSAEADLQFQAAPVGQGISVKAQAKNVQVGANRVAQLNMDATISDALGIPLVNGTLNGTDIAAGGVTLATLSAQANQVDQSRMAFSANSRLAIGTLADFSGSLSRLQPGFAVTLDGLNLRQDQQTARLRAPATITLQNDTISLTPLALDMGTGTLTAQGTLGDSYDLSVDIANLPLALANTVAPQLGLGGAVNGSARVTGPRTTPNIAFNLGGVDVVSNMTKSAGLPPIAFDAKGTTEGDRLAVNANVTSGDGLSADARGSIPLGNGDLALDLALQSFPLALIDRVAGNQGLSGSVTGTGRVTGPITDPAVAFNLRGSGISANLLDANGLPPVDFAATGGFEAASVTLDSASISGIGGLNITGSGRIPLSGPGLDISVDGEIPLALANNLLAERDAQAAGIIRLNASARGALAAPQLNGTVTLNDGTLVDPLTNIRLEGVRLDLALNGNVANIRTFSANFVGGGNATASGAIVLDAARGFPADIALRQNQIHYTDGSFIATVFSGNLAIKGPIMGGGGLVSGQIDLEKTEISVAEGLGAGGGATLEQVTHINTPPGVAATLKRAKLGEPSPPQSTGRTDLALDILLRAPRQIFVRGRGLDVEMGGQMVIRGTLSDIQPVGQFDLRRGRLSILSQRIEIEEGSLQLVGNLDPQLHFVATTVSGDVTAIITINGSASAPNIVFSSQPPLPQDEVLSRIIFNRSADGLSAFQLAQLAAAAAELAGAGGNSLLSQLRSATGLDDLDIITEEDGSTAVRAGKYLSQNVYVDVQTGSDGVSRAEINLDISRSVAARGSVSSDGNTTIGVFFERDY